MTDTSIVKRGTKLRVGTIFSAQRRDEYEHGHVIWKDVLDVIIDSCLWSWLEESDTLCETQMYEDRSNYEQLYRNIVVTGFKELMIN